MSQQPSAVIKFVSEAKMEKLLDAEFEEFSDDSPEAQKWENCLEQVKKLLCQFAQDEEAEESDGSPGFLLQDFWQGVMTIGMEFNDPVLISKPVLDGLAEITVKAASGIELGITCYLPGNDPEFLDMENLVIREGRIYAPNSKAMKNALSR